MCGRSSKVGARTRPRSRSWPVPSANGPRTAILYACVSGEDQAKKGYSLPVSADDVTRVDKAIKRLWRRSQTAAEVGRSCSVRG